MHALSSHNTHTHRRTHTSPKRSRERKSFVLPNPYILARGPSSIRQKRKKEFTVIYHGDECGTKETAASREIDLLYAKVSNGFYTYCKAL